MASRSLAKWMFFGIASAAILVGTIFDPKGLRRYGRLRREVEELSSRNAALAVENAKLALEVDALQHDRRFQERAVREELGFVRPGQILLELDADEPPPRTPALAGMLP